MLLSICLSVWRQALHFIPVGTRFTGTGTSIEMLDRIAPENAEIIVDGRQDVPCIIETIPAGGYSGAGVLCLVNESYFAFLDLTFVSGGLSELFADLCDHLPVVISDDLACRLFFTLDCIGSQISINGQRLTIAGVYEEPTSILHRISLDGKDLLYVPYFTEGQDAEANLIFIRPMADETVQEEEIARLDASLGGKLQSYTS